MRNFVKSSIRGVRLVDTKAVVNKDVKRIWIKKSKGRKKNNGQFVKEMLESTDAKERRKEWRKDLKITESSSCATREQTLRTKLKHVGKKINRIIILQETRRERRNSTWPAKMLEDDTERTEMTTRHGEAGILEFMQGIQTRRGIKMARVFPRRSCGQNYEMKML